MKCAVVVALVCALALCADARTLWHQLDASTYTFSRYLQEHGKSYSDPAEYARREAIFRQALDEIIAFNKDTSNTYKQGVNMFTDMTHEEFSTRLGYKKGYANALKAQAGSNVIGKHAIPAHKVGFTATKEEIAGLPTSVDWRTAGVLTPVKDQGNCGSCWAFASTAMIESYVALSSKPPVLFELSPQQLVSCAANPDQCGGIGGCEGSIPELAFDYVAENGMTSEWFIPYTSHDGKSCMPSCPCVYDNSTAEVTITGHVKLPENDYASVLKAVATIGPMAVNVQANTWSRYESGIFPANGCDLNNTDIDHVVQLVGYGSENGNEYWTIRNSWTPTWGEHGFIRLSRDDSSTSCTPDLSPLDGTGCAGGPNPSPKSVSVCGTCGVLYDVSYPTGAKIL